MKITAALVWVTLCVASGFALFSIAFAVEDLESELAAINSDIEREREALHVLEAEWTYLNRPDRIEDLANQLLPHLAPPTIEQLVAMEDIPYPSEIPPSASLQFPFTETTGLTSHGAEAPAVVAPRRSTLSLGGQE
ncbi:cell division protein FtsL [Hwanghaeella sp.]|uniref:cell division protein FtsL n=1 Tax=Hwanghaeella sp. TaxID=2605943 RepID=UPI003CCB87B2